MTEPKDHFPDLDTALVPTGLLSAPQFTSEDAMSICGVSKKQLEHAIDPARTILRLSIHNRERVKGRRRMFTGGDILKIAALFAASAVGFPARWFRVLADDVERRAIVRIGGGDLTPNLAYATWPMRDGEDWARTALHDALTVPPKLPSAVIIIAVDQLIDQTIAKLEAVIAEQPIPDFSVPDPAPAPSPYSPENDFFLAWTKDEAGRDVRVGLSFAETEEYERLIAPDRSAQTSCDRDRFTVLDERHEAARHKRIADATDISAQKNSVPRGAAKARSDARETQPERRETPGKKDFIS